jgi:acetoacetate decarboxylase
MKIRNLAQNSSAMSPTSPSLLRGPYNHCSRQILIITYCVCRVELVS